jgi:HSP20 family protein
LVDILPFRKRREYADNLFCNEIIKDFWVDDLFSDPGLSSIRADIKERKNEYIIEADLPGVNKEQMVVEYIDEILTISAEKRKEESEEIEYYVRRERKHGKITRSFFMPKVDSEKITADYIDGVLKITLPKLKEAIK